jgi:hypothetical protein
MQIGWATKDSTFLNHVISQIFKFRKINNLYKSLKLYINLILDKKFLLLHFLMLGGIWDRR